MPSPRPRPQRLWSNWPGERPEYQSCSNVLQSFYSRAAVRTHDLHLCSRDPLSTASYSESSFSSAIYWKIVGLLFLLPVFFSYLELPLKSQSVKAFYRYFKNESFGKHTCFLISTYAHICGNCRYLYCCSLYSDRPGPPSPPRNMRVSSWPPRWGLCSPLVFSHFQSQLLWFINLKILSHRHFPAFSELLILLILLILCHFICT